MRKKYLVLLLLALVIALVGCGKKKLAPPPIPIAPSNLTAEVISSNEINLTWKDNATTEKGFYVYRKTVGDYARVAVMVGNATSYNDTGLSPETTYRYKVSAYNDQGESARSNEATVTTPGEEPPPPEPLEPPTNVGATAISYKQIDLTWQDNSDEDSFRIACDMGVGQNQFLVRLPANITHYEHRKLQPMTQYKYYVVAERGGEDASSEQVSATTPCPATVRVHGGQYYSPTLFHVWGVVWGNASGSWRIELTALVYDLSGNLIGTNKETFEPFMPDTAWFTIEVVLPSPEGPVLYPEVNYRVEVTDMEIEY